MNVRDRRGLKPSSAHGPRAQAEERRIRRRHRDTVGRGEEKERQSGELVSSCSSRSDNDGAVLPSNAAGKFTSRAPLICFVHVLRFATAELEKQEVADDFVSVV